MDESKKLSNIRDLLNHDILFQYIYDDKVLDGIKHARIISISPSDEYVQILHIGEDRLEWRITKDINVLEDLGCHVQ